MTGMRFDIHKVRAYLVNELLNAPGTIADVRHDGTDIILVDLRTGEQIIIYLIERLMPISEITETLAENAGKGLHTLFILWSDMLLPTEERMYLPEDWMEALYTLYGDLIYGYDSFAQFASVFPVYFEDVGQGFERYIRYGPAINVAHLRCETVHTDNRFLQGIWRVASFEAGHKGSESQQRPYVRVERRSMEAHYATLAVAPDADRATVRAAYRRLARRYHPDLNRSPEAHAEMQRINEAYRRIMQQLEGDT